MIYVVVFIFGGMLGAMLMALTIASGTPDDDELEQNWKDIEELLEEEENK